MMFTGLLFFCAAQQASYTFTVVDDPQPEVHARLTLTEFPDHDEALVFTMPQGFAFAQLPEPMLRGKVTVRPGLAESTMATIQRIEPYRWEVDRGGAQKLVLEWVVPLEHRSHPEVVGRDEYEYPYLADDHGMLVMGTLALAPDEIDGEDIQVRFEVPAGWAVHAPWPRAEDGSYRPARPESMLDDLIAIGNWQVHQEQARGMQLTMAFAPGQEQLRELVTERAVPVVSAMLDHFGVTPQSEYLFLFGRPDGRGYGGSPKTQSMTLFVDPSLPADFAAEGVTHLIAHEFHHTWMRARCQPVDDLRFVAEGFTDYFAYLIPKRIGLLSEGAWRTEMQKQLAQAETSQMSENLSLQSAGGDLFFQGGAAYQTVYSGGLCMALWMDLALQRADKPSSTEQVLRHFYESPRWLDGTRPQPDDFWDTLGEMGYEDIAHQALRMSQQKLVDWQQAFAQIGLELKREVVPAQLSIRANFDGTTIAGIDPKGTGGRIGIQDGDVLLSVNGVQVESEQDVRSAFKLLVDDEKFVIVLMRGETQVTIDHDRPSDVMFTLPAQLAK